MQWCMPVVSAEARGWLKTENSWVVKTQRGDPVSSAEEKKWAW